MALSAWGWGVMDIGIVLPLELVKERHQSVVWAELSRLAVKGDRLGKDLFLQNHIRIEIDLRGLDGFMPEPERDDGGIHPGMQQVHGRCVPQAVECDVFLLERGADFAGRGQVLFQKASDGIGAQLPAAHAGEDNAVLVSARFIEPCFEDCGNRLAQWNGALLAPLAENFDMCARAERDILTSQADHLGQTQARLQSRQQQRVIPATVPGALVRCTQEAIDLGTRQEVDELAIEPLGRHCQDALYLGAVCRHFIGSEAEERSDSSEAQIAHMGGHAPRLLLLVKEGGDERRVELLEGQPVREGVCALTRFCCIKRWVKKLCRRVWKVGIEDFMLGLPHDAAAGPSPPS